MTEEQIEAVFVRVRQWPERLQEQALQALQAMAANGGHPTAEQRAMLAGREPMTEEYVDAFLKRPLPE